MRKKPNLEDLNEREAWWLRHRKFLEYIAERSRQWGLDPEPADERIAEADRRLERIREQRSRLTSP